MKITYKDTFKLWLIWLAVDLVVMMIASFFLPTWMYVIVMVGMIGVYLLIMRYCDKLKAQHRQAQLSRLTSLTYPTPPDEDEEKEEPVDNPSDRRDKN